MIPTTVAVRRFFRGLEQALDHGDPFGELFLRIGRSLSPSYRRKIARNLIYNEFIAGYRRRRASGTESNWVPSFFVMSPTMRCNRSCRGCYSGLYDKNEVLPYEEMDRLLFEARSLGIYFVVISGGEPYLIADQLLRLFARHDEMFFLTYTNGTLLDDALCRQHGGAHGAAVGEDD